MFEKLVAARVLAEHEKFPSISNHVEPQSPTERSSCNLHGRAAQIRSLGGYLCKIVIELR